MFQVCAECGAQFDPYPLIGDERLNLLRRKRCLECLPRRRLRGPREGTGYSRTRSRGRPVRSCDPAGLPTGAPVVNFHFRLPSASIAYFIKSVWAAIGTRCPWNFQAA